MQSPALFLLHHKMYKGMRGLELQGALLRLLNPRLASHEYESERDNRDMRLVLDGDLEPVSAASVAKQREAWISAQSITRSSVHFGNDRPSEWAGLAENQFEAARRALHRLCNADELMLSPTLMRDMYWSLTLMKGNPGRVRYAYNRFMSILDQVDIVRRSRVGGGPGGGGIAPAFATDASAA